LAADRAYPSAPYRRHQRKGLNRCIPRVDPRHAGFRHRPEHMRPSREKLTALTGAGEELGGEDFAAVSRVSSRGRTAPRRGQNSERTQLIRGGGGGGGGGVSDALAFPGIFAQQGVEFGIFERPRRGASTPPNIVNPGGFHHISRIDFVTKTVSATHCRKAHEKAGSENRRGDQLVLAEQRPEALEVSDGGAPPLGCPVTAIAAAYRVAS